MEINLNRSLESVPKIKNGAAHNTDRPNHAPALDLSKSEALETKLRAEAEVRPEVVERAQQLVRSSSYPPAEAIEKIATLLAANIGNPGE